MGDAETSSSCSRAESLGLSSFCSDSSMNDTEICRKMETLIFFLKADCYITRVFIPLTGILIVIGTILNSFSLYCFLKMNKRNSQNVYLSALSLVDTMNLHINFTLPMLRRSIKFDDSFRNLKFICRFTGVLTEFFLIFPTWIVVLLTSERLICILWPLKRRSSYSQTRAKTSIVILAIIVLLISLYRLKDLKGIDQVSVFAVVACNDTHTSIPLMRNFNLMIWTIVPECLTLIMSLIIIYEIKLATKQFERDNSKSGQSRYGQATKTVLLISILFLIFHTPTGMNLKFE
jgi:hypothetical protein